jgi:hypothetical protein
MSKKPIASTEVRTRPSTRGTADPSTYRHDIVTQESLLPLTFLKCFNLEKVTQAGSDKQDIMASTIYSVSNRISEHDGYDDICSELHQGKTVEIIKEEIPVHVLPTDELATYTMAKVEEYGKAKTLFQLRQEVKSA